MGFIGQFLSLCLNFWVSLCLFFLCLPPWSTLWVCLSPSLCFCPFPSLSPPLFLHIWMPVRPDQFLLSEYQNLLDTLGNLKMPTESLVAKYYRERFEEQSQPGASLTARLVVLVRERTDFKSFYVGFTFKAINLIWFWYPFKNKPWCEDFFFLSVFSFNFNVKFWCWGLFLIARPWMKVSNRNSQLVNFNMYLTM